MRHALEERSYLHRAGDGVEPGVVEVGEGQSHSHSFGGSPANYLMKRSKTRLRRMKRVKAVESQSGRGLPQSKTLARAPAR